MNIVLDLVIGILIWPTLPGIDPGASAEWFLDDVEEDDGWRGARR